MTAVARRAAPGRARIVAVAEKMFADDGYDMASTKAIALASGLTIGALYHHFDSKDALYRAVMEAALAKLEPAPAALFGEGQPEAQLRGLIGWFSRTISAPGGPAALLRREMLEPRLAQSLGTLAVFRAPLDQFRALMRALAPGANVALAQAAIIAMSFGLTNLGGMRRVIAAEQGEVPEDGDAIADVVTQLVLCGIG